MGDSMAPMESGLAGSQAPGASMEPASALVSPSTLLVADGLIRSALEEDMNAGDISTDCVMPSARWGQVDLICKQDGVLAGIWAFERTFELLDPATRFEALARDGDRIVSGQLLGTVHGDVRVLLSGERTALNYLQRMCGIATATRRAAKVLAGSGTTLVDTRKTTPNMRIFEKYAVRVGGGTNHRYNLSDAVMLKDNHIAAAGGIEEAVAAARRRAPYTCRIEVEVESLDQVREALDAGADIIMLDNMNHEQMAEAVRLIGHGAQVECSGNFTLDNLGSVRDLGVDFVSSGALTHSAGILDLSMKNLTVCG